jgi:putative hydrolase of the HAD superfamily
VSGAPLRAVIFDWGGTLADYAEVELLDMWRLAAAHLAPHVGANGAAATAHEDAVAARLAAVETAFWERTAADQRSGTLAELLAEASAALGADVAEALLEETAVRYLDTWTPHIRHDAEAVEVLRGLRERGLRIGLLSNTHWPRAFHERFLERDGLAALIDARLYTSELPYMKPHASAFAAALAALDVADPACALFVGDRAFDDVHGAQRAGLRAVLRHNPAVPAFEVLPDAQIARLGELLPLVDGWLREPPGP